VGPIMNLPGIKPGQIKLTGPILAGIYLGEIKKWNDPQIAALNKGVPLPNLPITVVHRSDGSGTTFIYSSYLSLESAEWKSKVGAGTAVSWPTGLGGKGSEGVSAFTKQTLGSIGYVEYAYALQNKMTFTKMINKDGKTVSPTSDAFQAAAANADWNSVPGYGVILANQAGATSWPMTAATFILIPKQPQDTAATAEALKFFAWAYAKGAKMAEELDYVPMPSKVITTIEAMWAKSITDTSGKPLHVTSN